MGAQGVQGAERGEESEGGGAGVEEEQPFFLPTSSSRHLQERTRGQVSLSFPL